MAVENLQTAIDTNRDIGAAVGILMARHNVDYQVAFLLLRSVSQNDNRKLRDVAAEVLTTVTRPAARPGNPCTQLKRPAVPTGTDTPASSPRRSDPEPAQRAVPIGLAKNVARIDD